MAIPGALARYWRTGRLRGPLVRRLALGTLPGIVIGAVIRVQFAAGGDVFRLLLSLLLLPLGLWLLLGSTRPSRPRWTLDSRRVTLLALGVGVVGGLYGIGGGSILAPILVAGGYAVAEVAPAALSATFLTSVVGVATYSVMASAGAAAATPDYRLGLWLSSAGLIGGAIGADSRLGCQSVVCGEGWERSLCAWPSATSSQRSLADPMPAMRGPRRPSTTPATWASGDGSIPQRASGRARGPLTLTSPASSNGTAPVPITR